MRNKKTETKFTIQFSRADPLHKKVSGLLNQQARYGKSQFIVDAVTHYINCGFAQAEAAPRPVRIDEKHIEAVVNRILLDWRENGGSVFSFSAGMADDPSPPEPAVDGAIVYNEDAEALGEDGYNAIAGALEKFRKK